MKQLLVVLFFSPCLVFAQNINGKVINKNTNKAVEYADIEIVDLARLQTNEEGLFTLPALKFPAKIICSADDFESDTLTINTPDFITFSLIPKKVTELGPIVISASRREQKFEEVSVSMDIIKPTMIANKGIATVDQAINQAPGAYAMDGQISIRGGSGFSYGAGSRVMVVWNDVPLLSGDAGDAKWNSIPIENAAQIEVIKGASSVLYGSGALNGIVSMVEKEPGPDLMLNAKVQSGIFSDPKRESLNWRNKNPMQTQADVSFGKTFGNVGLNLGFAGYKSDGYRAGETEDRIRINGTIYYRTKKIKNLKASLGWNAQVQKTGNFIVWKSAEEAYTPAGGADTSVVGSSLTFTRGTRVSIDPSIKYIDKFSNKHHLKTRYFLVDNYSYNDPSQSTFSTVMYANYQFQRSWNKDSWILTSGLTSVNNTIKSNLFGDHVSYNASAYAQVEKKIGELDISGGFRAEYFTADKRQGDSYFYNKDSTKSIPFYPIFRSGLHYKLFKYTHLRASYGQGVRYPSVAERYTQTAVGSLLIFPNPAVQRETGWAGEIGIKQGVKISNWKGFFDIAGFINQYDNMMEFQAGVYNPPGTLVSLNPNNPYFILKWFGFRSENAEKARISGIETSFTGEGKIKEVTIQTLIGYTYMNPISLNSDKDYLKTFSDTTGYILKYRFKHMAKADVQVEYKGISCGFSIRYNSFMKNIDKVFEEGLLNSQTTGQILPGLKQYRIDNNGPSTVFDARVGYTYKEKYKVALIMNNVFNVEFTTRPGDIQAPRLTMVQLSYKF